MQGRHCRPGCWCRGSGGGPDQEQRPHGEHRRGLENILLSSRRHKADTVSIHLTDEETEAQRDQIKGLLPGGDKTRTGRQVRLRKVEKALQAGEKQGQSQQAGLPMWGGGGGGGGLQGSRGFAGRAM